MYYTLWINCSNDCCYHIVNRPLLYVSVCTLKIASSLNFTGLQTECILPQKLSLNRNLISVHPKPQTECILPQKPSVPRNVLSVHPKNQFLNSDVFPTMYYNKFKKKLVLARILKTLTNYPFISVHVYMRASPLKLSIHTIPLQGFHSVLFKSRSWAFVTNPNFSISISLQPVVIDLKYFKQWIMLGQIV